MATIYRNYKDNVFCLLYRDRAKVQDNPNMPLRFLHYISEEYRHIVPERDLYRQNAVSIPAPHFIVFYNGTAPQPERQVYKLSELYEDQMGEPELEIRAVMLNINKGNNKELMERCRTLSDYMKFVDKVRRSQKTLGQGLQKKRVELVCRKLKKGKPIEQIAEELEESTEELQPIINTAERFAPDYDVDRIMEEIARSSRIGV